MDPGLCRNCKHSNEIRTDRGSVFLMCKRGLSEPEFPKYPRLPVLHCLGFEQKTAQNTGSGPSV